MNRDYVVLLKGPRSGDVRVPMMARTPHLAAAAAEAATPGGNVTDVILRLKCLGRCCRCKGFVFKGDSPNKEQYSDELRCPECA